MADKSHSGTPDRRAGGNPAYADWITVKFTDVLDVQGGTQPPKSQFIDAPKEGYIRLLQIRDFGAKPVPTYIPDTSKLKKCEEDDLLIGRYGASLGRICSGMVGAYNVALAKVLSVESLHKPFLKSYLESELFQQPLALLSRSAQNGFNKDDLATFDFVLPPLAEQKVIAEKLDTLLAQVDTTKARLERIPDIIKRFRQSVLAAAVSGKLTGVQVNPIGQIKDCANVVSGLAFKKAEYSNEGSRLLQIANVGYGSTKWDSPNYIPLELAESCIEYSMQAGDIVLALNRPITNDTLKVAWIRDEDLPATLYQRVARLRCNESLIDPSYLFLAMQSKEFLEVVSKNLKGSDQPYLNTSDLSSFSIAAPEKEEQTEIVRRVEELFAFADSIEQKAAAALERVNNLTQSILAKAFRGELTSDWRAANPELISGDNSAEALLVKIQAEREALKPVKKTRKKKAKA